MDLTDVYCKVADCFQTSKWAVYKEFGDSLYRFDSDQSRIITSKIRNASHVLTEAHWSRVGRFVDEAEAHRPVIVVQGVPYFDVSQTFGRDLPTVAEFVTGEAPRGLYKATSDTVRRFDFRVRASKTELATHTSGETRWASRTVVINANRSTAHKVKTVIHETAHVYLHRREISVVRAEIEAETIAYLTAHRFGVDSSAYSVGYLASWSGDAATLDAQLEQSEQRINNAVTIFSERIADQLAL